MKRWKYTLEVTGTTTVSGDTCAYNHIEVLDAILKDMRKGDYDYFSLEIDDRLVDQTEGCCCDK